MSDGQVKTSSNVQAQSTTQTLQPAAAAPTNATSSVRTLTGYRFHWSHAIVAVGLLAVSGAGTAILLKVKYSTFLQSRHINCYPHVLMLAL